jgi:hypothetical protein
MNKSFTHSMFTISRYTIGAILALATCVGLYGAEPGFTPLLDESHTDGWSYLGDGAMKVADGVATTSQQHDPKSGLDWYQDRTFADFTLKLEFKVDMATSNSGVYLRFPDPGNDYKVAGDKGYEIDIYGEKTGTIIFLNTKLRPAKPTPVTPGSWNEMTVTVVGQKYTVEVNGRVVNEYLGNRARTGFIGLQTWHGEGDVHFRNVRIKDVSAENTSAEAPVAKQKPAPSKQIEPLLDPSLDAILAPLEKDPQMPRVAVEKLRASLSAGEDTGAEADFPIRDFGVRCIGQRYGRTRPGAGTSHSVGTGAVGLQWSKHREYHAAARLGCRARRRCRPQKAG